MLENRNELEIMKSRFPYLYDKFLEIDKMGIKLMVSCNLENALEEIPEVAVFETVEYLLNEAIQRLKNTKFPTIFFLLYEKNGLRMEVAYTNKRIPFWIKWRTDAYFVRLCKKYRSKTCYIRHHMVEMQFKGRDCICHCVQFS